MFAKRMRAVFVRGEPYANDHLCLGARIVARTCKPFYRYGLKESVVECATAMLEPCPQRTMRKLTSVEAGAIGVGNPHRTTTSMTTNPGGVTHKSATTEPSAITYKTTGKPN